MFLKTTPALIAALDAAIANQSLQHTEAELDALKDLKQRLQTLTTVEQAASLVVLALRILAAAHALQSP